MQSIDQHILRTHIAGATDPEVAWVSLADDQAKVQGIKVKKGGGRLGPGG
ncbi:hypothetical protein [Comamonas avium]|uniref:Uncharacterized protein n=1 Tax=Comamonas avium TaxID=2762231 RepID=A0ABR8S711_9BURK|nr:hypothetical protein [Comamonas avium]MBD7959275.1 hypothetical protein [Comamonas avium]